LAVIVNEKDEDFPHRGEIWMVETPNQPDDPHQPRPALVVSENMRNRRRDSIIIVPIFSSGALGPTRVPVRAGSAGLGPVFNRRGWAA
jgi:mRNA-degrading endonuclease toxin of MazEF toxin-antitoxin module